MTNAKTETKDRRQLATARHSVGAASEVKPQAFGRVAGPALRRGFTIVELLIVIVVIAILAAISIVAYTGIQQRARDAQRANDIATITKALELYYIDHGRFPTANGGSSTINPAWSTTADASWAHLEQQLVPKYIASLPKDPVSTPGGNPQTGNNYNYAYFVTGSSSVNYCGAEPGQMYILVYQREAGEQINRLEGECTANPLLYSASNVRVVR